MSLNIVTIINNNIVTAADTAVSTEIKGEKYRVHNESKKIFHIDDMVVYLSGNADLSKIIIDEFIKCKDHSIENLKRIIVSWCDKFMEFPVIKVHYSKGKDFLIGSLVSKFENGLAVMYEISQEHNFEIRRMEISKNQTAVYAIGVNSEVASKYLDKLIYDGVPVLQAYQDTYNKLSSSEIGGQLELFIMDGKSIKKIPNYSIKEKDSLKWRREMPYRNTERFKHMMLDANITGSSLTLRDNGGVMKMFPLIGLWAGAENFADAPFSVDLQGSLIGRKAKFIGPKGDILIDTEAGYIDMDKLDIINVGKLVAEMLEVNTILADGGYVNNLTVNRLKTIGKDVEVGQYIDYIDIQDNFIKFITARVSTKTQAKDSRDRLLYWQNGEKRILTTENTGIIAYEYGFNDADIKEKRVLTFEESGDAATPVEYIGTGDNTGNGRVVNRKRNGGYKSEYKSSNYGFERSIDLNDDGISVRSDKGKFSAISKEFEFLAQEGSLKMGISGGSIFELTPTGAKMDIKGDLDIKATGTVTINGQTIKLN
ncbi:hypothetical protein [Paenibacillus odorifer]|uniref:hypothetical protein n=1 Tax=Paenibacillus odorifer TaxID=189426 RepID=UPI00096DF2AC|nr:hypothetical protein [Paenibacillus odorifer]OMD78248.1 hypothetical protein BSK50_10900 [Paenibacillus odorifer]